MITWSLLERSYNQNLNCNALIHLTFQQKINFSYASQFPWSCPILNQQLWLQLKSKPDRFAPVLICKELVEIFMRIWISMRIEFQRAENWQELLTLKYFPWNLMACGCHFTCAHFFNATLNYTGPKPLYSVFLVKRQWECHLYFPLYRGLQNYSHFKFKFKLKLSKLVNLHVWWKGLRSATAMFTYER